MTDIEGLAKRLEELAAIEDGYALSTAGDLSEAASALRSLQKALADAEAMKAGAAAHALSAEARLKEAVEVVMDVTASLMAASSLLALGGKKAAASDRMFDQMLADYDASITRARSFLQSIGGEAKPNKGPTNDQG